MAHDIADVDFTTVPRPFKAPAWRTPARRHKPAKAAIADEQRRLQALAAAETEQHQDTDTPKPQAAFHASYSALDAPPSVRPRKWWCDVTGLEGRYRSVRNGLRYHNAEVYGIVQGMAPGVDQQYLELRNANVVLK